MASDRAVIAADPTASSAAVKAGVAWGGVIFAKMGIQTWSDVAAVMATVYTSLLIVAWVWRAVRRWRAGRSPIPGDTDKGELS